MAAMEDRFVPSESLLTLKKQMFSMNKADKTPLRSRPAPPKASDDVLDPLVELYDKHGGNLSKIFAELGEDPGKAMKYPPATGPEFAAKYVEGRYTYVANIEKIRGTVLERLDGDEDLLSVCDPEMPSLMELEDDDVPLHPLEILKAVSFHPPFCSRAHIFYSRLRSHEKYIIV